MTTLNVQRFLRESGTVADLATRYAIKATRSIAHPNLILLKYSQKDSPMGEPIVQECRGLILDEAADWRVVSRSFSKFFNHGEGHAAPIDWATAQVQEKVDGSLCVLHHYAGEWRVQTSGHPDAAGRVGDTDRTFADLFWDVWRSHGYALPPTGVAERFCFSFELMTKWNRVIVIHEQPRLVHIGTRDRESGQEHSVHDWSIMPFAMPEWQRVRSFQLQSFEQIAATFATMQPLQQEGYVVVDGQFNRVKVKHPGYVAIHHLKDGYSTRRLVEIVQAGEVGEFTTYFPEWKEEFADVAARLSALTAEVEADYARIQDPAKSQKDFALEAVKTRLPAALFSLRAGKVPSIAAFVAKAQPESLIQLLGLKDVKPATEGQD